MAKQKIIKYINKAMYYSMPDVLMQGTFGRNPQP